MNRFECTECKRWITNHDRFVTGYGINQKGEKVCYKCCVRKDEEYMEKNGRIALYLSKNNDGRWIVSNWPGTLVYPVISIKEGRHNIAHTRTDVRFKDKAGCFWHGVQYGEFTQICYCRRIKSEVERK